MINNPWSSMYSIRLGQPLSILPPQSVVPPLWFVSGKRKKLNAAAADGRGRVYVSGRGAPLYVTHFLYHIPRLYCISSDVVWHQQLLAVNSHFISMLTGEKQTVQEMKRCSDCLSDYCCWWENPPPLLLLLLYNTALIPTAALPAPHTTVSTHSTLSFVHSEAEYLYFIDKNFPFSFLQLFYCDFKSSQNTNKHPWRCLKMTAGERLWRIYRKINQTRRGAFCR